MSPPVHLTAFAPPSEAALLDFARARVSREMIHEIAKNDYGNDVAMYELGISRQLAPKPELGISIWIKIGEVLWLESVSEPEEIKRHLKRLFASTILLRNAGYVAPEKYSDGEFFLELSVGFVIQLVRSALAIGSEASRIAIGFLLWFHDKQSSPLLRPYASLGALILETQEDPTSKDLLQTCDWVEQEERLARQQLGCYSDRWLLGQEAKKEAQRWIDALAQVVHAQHEHLPSPVELRLREMLARMSQ